MKISFPFLSSAALLTASVLLAGCQNGTGDGNSATPGNTVGSAAPSGGKPKQIAAILMQDDQFYRLAQFGMEAAAKKHNVELLTGSAGGALDKEISLVDTYASRGVGAILVQPNNPKGSVPALQRAASKGVKIVTYGVPLGKPFVSGGLQSDDVTLGSSTGKVAAQYIQKKFGGKAKIAILDFISQSSDIGPLRPQGFKAEMQKLPGVEIVAQQSAWLAPDAERVTTDILNAHPDITVIWGANEGATVGATTAVKNAGKAGKVAVFGTDVSEQIANFLLSNDNILQASTGQKPYEMGFNAVESAVEAIDGKKLKALTIIPGQLYSRDNPAASKAFLDQVKKLS
ncbi:monosaccharide ABC transporter substrate-binding protein, CUT2 family [Abditibacterium utsteinense]|uniref:Monosaccharide ABC transporter substrate-binding protein, CUT2 family n=1 Tax=Abditibacterium utsteinense TaxID=1960156 RepID=A0A2S8SR40_9BACT|nr:substrate-binding domain-containing protein [Abditibacterium utsteinense]PQV63281.1 monosaccharide ABC transporter substrate-binding protein, CUT2 family [Abditibacterium utsteinense]